MAGFLSIKNFETYQHYKDRNPPWIKLHQTILSDYEFCQLEDASKAHLLAIGLLASRLCNKIPNDIEWIGKQIGAKSPIDLDALVASGFIIIQQSASKALSSRKRKPIAERESEVQVERESEISSLRSDIADWVPKEAWNGFVEMRKRIRAPMTPRAVALKITLLEKLKSDGHDPAAVLDQSTSNCWKDLYPIKEPSDARQPAKRSARRNFIEGAAQYIAGLEANEHRDSANQARLALPATRNS